MDVDDPAQPSDDYAAHRALYGKVAVPGHVPPGLVVDFDYLQPPGMEQGKDVYTAWKRLHAGPDII